MRIAELMRGVLDLLATQEEPSAEIKTRLIAIPVDSEDDLVRIKQNAGLGTDSSDYSNTPDEKYADISAAYPEGDDVHQRKHPSDIRADSVSMYPNFQARE